MSSSQSVYGNLQVHVGETHPDTLCFGPKVEAMKYCDFVSLEKFCKSDNICETYVSKR